MAEEQRCQEGHRLCANNCGFFGSPATLDLCSKCYRDLRLKEEQASSAKIAVEKSLSSPSSPIKLEKPVEKAAAATLAAHDAAEPSASPSPAAAPALDSAPAARPGRCAACNKRVGLTGFACRCGSTFCGAHRYPEKHTCGFDYKALGREAIERANPVVKAAKLDKI